MSEKDKKINARDDKPTSIRLGDLKPIYHEESLRIDRSIHWIMIKALKEYAKTFKK